MGRLVDPRPAGAKLFAAGQPGSGPKDALERAAQYVPAEVLGAYLGITALVESGTDADTNGRTWGLLVAFIVGIIFTPLYLNKMAEAGKPKLMHLVIATLAFGLWSYGMKGLWDDIGIYNAVVAGIVLIVFTLVSGLFAPTEGAR